MNLEIHGAWQEPSGKWRGSYSVNGRVTLTHWVRNPNVRNSEEAVRAARAELQNQAGGFQTVVTNQPNPF